MKILFLLLIICYTIFSCSESTPPEESNTLRNLALYANSQNPDDDNSNDNIDDGNGDNNTNETIALEELEIGDIANISLTDNGDGTHTFDYTGLGLDDSYNDKLSTFGFENAVVYFDDSNTIRHLTTFYNDSWALDANGNVIGTGADSYIENITSNYYKQSGTFYGNMADISWVSITITYTQPNGNSKCFYLKGRNNGHGEVQMVGYTITDSSNNIIEGDGDWDTTTPPNF